MNEEISREALLIYLNDLRTMETIIHESDNTIKCVEKKKNDLRNKNSELLTLEPKEPTRPRKPNKEEYLSGNSLYIFFAISFILMSIGYFAVTGISFCSIVGGIWIPIIPIVFVVVIEIIKLNNKKK